jgi:hypothetical protein
MRYQQIPPALPLGSVRQTVACLTGAPGSEDWPGISLKVTIISQGWMPRPSRAFPYPAFSQTPKTHPHEYALKERSPSSVRRDGPKGRLSPRLVSLSKPPSLGKARVWLKS